jgi:Domain of unknown function (DUF222)
MSPTATLSMSNTDIESALFAMTGNIASTRCRTLLMLAELEHRKAWRELGCRSGIHWLCRKLGLGRRAAMEQMRVALALISVPRITEEFEAGKISYSKVRAITRIATPDTEDELLRLALVSTAGKLERVVRQRRREDPIDDPKPDHGELRWRWDEDGCLRLRLRLPAAEGKLLITELEKLVNGPASAADIIEEATKEQPGQRPGEHHEKPAAADRSLDGRRAAALLALVTRNVRSTRSRRSPASRGPLAADGRSRSARNRRHRPSRAAKSRSGDRSRGSTRMMGTRARSGSPTLPAPRVPLTSTTSPTT